MSTRHLPPFLGAVVWFGAATWLAARGVFVSRPNGPPLALAVAFLAPLG